MKKITLLFLSSFTGFLSYAQKVNLDKEYIKTSYIRLPSHPVLAPEYRTFSINVTSTYELPRTEDRITIDGFEKVSDNGTINVGLEIGELIFDSVDIKKREEVKKDKEGNVTSRKFFYKPHIVYKTSAFYQIKDHLSDEVEKSNLGGRESFTGSEYSTYAAAKNYFENNRSSLRRKFVKKFVDEKVNQINESINHNYGYRATKYNALVWILDSKKNEDTPDHKKALADMQEVFSTMKYDQPVDEIKEKVKPIISYFESVLPKYNDLENKKHRKMRYASYFNIGYMYYYLDMPDKAIEYGNKLIENDYDKGDGKRLIELCEKLKNRFKVNEIQTRHFEIITTDNSNVDAVTSNVMIESPEEKEKREKLNRIFTLDLFFNFSLTLRNDNLSAIIDYIPAFEENIVESVNITSNLGGNKEDITLIYNNEGKLTQLNYMVDRDEGKGFLLFKYTLVYKNDLLEKILVKDKLKYKFDYLNGVIQSISMYKGELLGIQNIEYSDHPNKAKLRFDSVENGKVIKGNDIYKKEIVWNDNYKLVKYSLFHFDANDLKYDRKGNLMNFYFSNSMTDENEAAWEYLFDADGNWIKRTNKKTVIERKINYRQ